MPRNVFIYWGLLYQPVNLFPPRGRLAGRDCTRTATRATYQVTQCTLFALLKKFDEEKEILESRALLLSGRFDPPRVSLCTSALLSPSSSWGTHMGLPQRCDCSWPHKMMSSIFPLCRSSKRTESLARRRRRPDCLRRIDGTVEVVLFTSTAKRTGP